MTIQVGDRLPQTTFRVMTADGAKPKTTDDVFVMDAWAKASGGEGKVEFLADGNGDFAKALGLTLDASGNGLGVRSKRYSMVVDDGVVKSISVEQPGAFEVSSAEAVLKGL